MHRPTLIRNAKVKCWFSTGATAILCLKKLSLNSLLQNQNFQFGELQLPLDWVLHANLSLVKYLPWHTVMVGYFASFNLNVDVVVIKSSDCANLQLLSMTYPGSKKTIEKQKAKTTALENLLSILVYQINPCMLESWQILNTHLFTLWTTEGLKNGLKNKE